MVEPCLRRSEVRDARADTDSCSGSHDNLLKLILLQTVNKLLVSEFDFCMLLDESFLLRFVFSLLFLLRLNLFLSWRGVVVLLLNMLFQPFLLGDVCQVLLLTFKRD